MNYTPTWHMDVVKSWLDLCIESDWYTSPGGLRLEESDGPRGDNYISVTTLAIEERGFGNKPVGAANPSQMVNVLIRLKAHGSEAIVDLMAARIRSDDDDIQDATEELGATLSVYDYKVVDLGQELFEASGQLTGICDVRLGCTMTATRAIEYADTVTVTGSHNVAVTMED